jgi:hypothetical protein
MRESFGELILKKNSILYCSSCFTINEIIQTPEKVPILYYVFFHPKQYEWKLNIYKLILKKDISLFFDVEFKEKFPFIYSPLKNIANNPEMNELLDNKLKIYNFDGYFSNRFSQDDIIKIVLFNDNNLFNIELENYDQKMIYNNEYNSKYELSFTFIKPIININKRYEEYINKYVEYINSKIYNSYDKLTFYLFIKYSDINYIYENYNELLNILKIIE